MTAIFKRDFLSGLRNVTGFLFMALMMFFTSLYFFVYDIMQGSPDMTGAMTGSTLILIVGIPVLCMRSLSDERRTRTDQLLLTSPVSIGRIVLGKYLSLLGLFAIPMAIVCLFPLVMLTAGKPDLRLSYAAILAFFFYGAACIAICLFVSSITESQVIAAVLSAGILIMGYFMPGLKSLVSQEGNLITKVLTVFDMSTPFERTIGGTFELASYVYYLSVIVFFLFLTVQSIQKRRYQVSLKHITAGAYSLSAVAVFLAILVFVNLIFSMLPEKYRSFDITKSRLNTLTSQTVDFISKLDRDVTLYVLNNENNKDETVDRTLRQYGDISEHISIEYVDPTANPKFTTKYTQEPVYAGSVIVTSGDISKVIQADELYRYEVNYQTYSYEETGYDAEGQLTSAIQYVTEDQHAKVYALQGHGEQELDPLVSDVIKKANFEQDSVSLVAEDAVPEDCSLLMINGAEKDLSEDDAKKISAYLEKGGKLLVTLNSAVDGQTHLEGLLSDYGIKVVDGVVVEKDENRIYAQNPLYLLPGIEYDSITESVSDGYVFMPYTKGMTAESAGDVTVTPLLTTSADSFARADLEGNNSSEFSEGDTEGPFDVGVKAVKGKAGEGEDASAGTVDPGTMVVVYGSESLFTSNADSVVAGFNQALFSGTLGAMVSEDNSSLISIPVKEYDSERLLFSTGTASLWLLGLVVLLPLALVITGVIIWNRRRKL